MTAMRKQRRADAAAAPAERIVRDRDPQQHDRRCRRRAGAGGHAAQRGLVERGCEAAQVEPHQRRRAAASAAASHASRRTLIQPGENASQR